MKDAKSYTMVDLAPATPLRRAFLMLDTNGWCQIQTDTRADPGEPWTTKYVRISAPELIKAAQSVGAGEEK